MKIEWNRVTWYSKAIALGLFVILVTGAFWFGIGYGEVIGVAAIGESAPNTAVSNSQTGAEYYSNVSEWQTSTPYSTVSANGNAGGFSIAYPIDFDVDDNAAASANWRQNSSEADAGTLYFTLTIPKAFQPQTNFSDATLTVGSSNAGTAVADCLTADPSGGPAEATSTATINGTNFTVFHSSDAGAGNLYETTSYRTIHGGQCYAVEYTLHSNEIANYPASYDLHPFDHAAVTGLLDRIVGTVKFD